MNTRSLKGAVALGSLTAAVALLAGLGTAQAQIGTGQGGPPGPAPTSAGAGSFPQSFLIPGTNTSLSLYGKVQMSIHDNIGSMHTSDTTPLPTVGAPGLGSLSLEGPGASGGTNFNNLFRSFHGGLRAQANSTNFAFETRTPSDLGEIKTVMLVDFGLLAGQGNYTGAGVTATNLNPKVGAGNNSIPRIQWAYGTLGPWLFGQYNSAWADPLLFAPDIGDQNQVGPMQTVNIRRPQIRYTYLVGNGISLSGSLEVDEHRRAVLPSHGDGDLYRHGDAGTGGDRELRLRQYRCGGRRSRQSAELQHRRRLGPALGSLDGPRGRRPLRDS